MLQREIAVGTVAAAVVVFSETPVGIRTTTS